MAETYDPYSGKKRALDRRSAVMEALMASSMQSRPTQMAGRVAVRQGPLDAVGRVATSYLSNRNLGKLDKEYEDLDAQRRAAEAEEIARLFGTTETGAQTPGINPDAEGGLLPERPTSDQGDFVDPKLQRALAGMTSPYPSVQRVAETLWKSGQPKYQVATTYNEQGLAQPAVVNVNDPSEVRPIGGAQRPDWQNPEYQDWRRGLAEAGRSSMSVTLPPQEKAFEAELGTQQAKDLIESRKAAGEAAEMLSTLDQGKQILNSGIISGFGAEAIVKFGQGLKQLGFDVGGDAVANSQAYAANMAQNVGKLIKQFGAGTGLSDADREYAEKMAGGKITLDEQALRKILDINERAAKNVIERHNARANGVKTNIPLTVEPPAPAQTIDFNDLP